MEDVDVKSKTRKSFLERINELPEGLEFVSEEGKFAIVKDKYGLLKVRKDTLLNGSYPKPSSALNKTQYYKNMLLEKYPHILDNLEILSEIKDHKSRIICKDLFGEISTTLNNLMDGNIPTLRSALNYKEYLRNKLKFIHKEFDYDFEVIDSEYSYLICSKHGKIKILNRYLLLGYVCPICSSDLGSNIFYLIKLTNSEETFYKIGISKRTFKGILRYKDYRANGYSITPIYEIEFNNSGDSKVLEQQVKEIIKNQLYNPKYWAAKTSKECFIGEELLIEVCSLVNLYNKNCDRIRLQ